MACVPTGVKHLHHAALAFDVGVYFEANGHGTVVFAPEAERRIREEAGRNNEAAKRMADVIDVINQVLKHFLRFPSSLKKKLVYKFRPQMAFSNKQEQALFKRSVAGFGRDLII